MTKLMLDFLDLIEREDKPRARGLTAVQDPGLGPRQLDAHLELTAPYVDYLKMQSYTFRLYPQALVETKIDLCHRNDIKVILGGNVGELAWLQGCWDRLADEARAFGWDAFEISETYVEFPADEKARMVRHCTELGYEVIYEWGLKKPRAPLDPARAGDELLALLEQGVRMIILEEGEVELLLGADGSAPHGDRLAELFERVGIGNLMMEAAHLGQVKWLLSHFGTTVNIGPNTTLDQVRSIEPMRRGIGRAVEYFHYHKFRPELAQRS